jgi:hypothetical protein
MEKTALAIALALLAAGCTDPAPAPTPPYTPEPIESGHSDGPPQFEQP